MIRIVIPGKPVAKGRPRMTAINGHARSFTPPKTVAYEGLVAFAGQCAMEGTSLLEGPVSVTLWAYFPLPKAANKARRANAVAGLEWHVSKPDGDNILKAICDGLNGVVWHDDAQVAQATVIKLYSETPRAVVEVKSLSSRL